MSLFLRNGNKMPIHSDYKSTYDSMIKKHGSKKGKEVFHATMKKQGLDYTKPRKDNSKKENNSKKEIKHSFLNGLSVKEAEGDNLVIEGFIATNHVDNTHLLPGEHLDDLIPEATLHKIAEQINTNSFANKLSVHHRDINPESAVAGVMKNAIVKDTDDGKKGVWVEATINKAHPEYTDIQSEIEQGMIDGFSIEFETLESHPQLIDSKEVRVLDNIRIGGTGLASRPINPNAQIVNHTYKEFLKFKTKEVSKMKETKEETPEAEVPAPAEEQPAEEVSNDDSTESKPEEETPAEEKPVEEPSEEKEFKEWKASQAKEALKKVRITEIKEALQDMPLANMPRFQTGTQITEQKEFKSLVGGYKKSHMECKEFNSIVNANKDDGKMSRTGDLNLQLKEAARLYNKLVDIHGQVPLGPMRMGSEASWDSIPDPGMGNSSNCGLGTQNFEVKESHWLNLEKKADPFTTTTNKISAASHYQASPQMADVYDPVIYNIFNDKATTYGLLKKVDGSKYANQYGFRVAYGGHTVSGAQAEGATITPDSTDRIRLQQPFKYYYAAVKVTGQTIAFARGQGAMGDILAIEVADATRQLLHDINANLMTGTEDGSADGNELMGLTYLCEKGSSYADIYNQVSRNTYKLEGNSDALSTENISKGELRKLIRACEAGDSGLQQNNGGLYSKADKADLMIVTHHLQKDKILALFDDAQRFNSVSARAGFEGLPTFDGVPIHADNQCTNSVLFVIDTKNTFISVSVPPTFTAWGQRYNYDESSGFIKTYLNLVCTAPGNNAMVTGLKTT